MSRSSQAALGTRSPLSTRPVLSPGSPFTPAPNLSSKVWSSASQSTYKLVNMPRVVGNLRQCQCPRREIPCRFAVRSASTLFSFPALPSLPPLQAATPPPCSGRARSAIGSRSLRTQQRSCLPPWSTRRGDVNQGPIIDPWKPETSCPDSLSVHPQAIVVWPPHMRAFLTPISAAVRAKMRSNRPSMPVPADLTAGVGCLRGCNSLDWTPTRPPSPAFMHT